MAVLSHVLKVKGDFVWRHHTFFLNNIWHVFILLFHSINRVLAWGRSYLRVCVQLKDFWNDCNFHGRQNHSVGSPPVFGTGAICAQPAPLWTWRSASVGTEESQHAPAWFQLASKWPIYYQRGKPTATDATTYGELILLFLLAINARTVMMR